MSPPAPDSVLCTYLIQRILYSHKGNPTSERVSSSLPLLITTIAESAMSSLRFALTACLTVPLTGPRVPKFKVLGSDALGDRYWAWCEVQKLPEERVVLGFANGEQGLDLTASAFCPHRNGHRRFHDSVDGEDSLKGALGKALTPGSGWAAGMSGISSRKLKCKKAIEEITKKLRKGDPELNLRAGPVCAGCVKPEEYFVERVCDMAYSLSLKQEEPSSTTEQPEVPAESIGVAEEEAQGSTQEE
ncbi:hypothetical protein FOZ60_011212 [Perkinsus olseni]|uniref:Uncharacterized protein n=1 Tax=Perkinsus olseni TaxID=32597 RepID=A0A7J6NDS4_PEROL|nr:hypothetical protein FOZ60_011212 [Perkinsus olseni]